MLKERANKLNESIKKRLEEIKLEQDYHVTKKKKDLEIKEKQLLYIDEEFDRIIKKLNDRRTTLKASYEAHISEEISAVDKDIEKKASIAEKFTLLQGDITSLVQKFGSSHTISSS